MIKPELIEVCRTKLLEAKSDILNSLQYTHNQLKSMDHKGDETDLAINQQAEHAHLVTRTRLQNRLLKIEHALARIENNCFGFCEETDEPIEEKRLLTIPWTSLSIEGAEIREALQKKYLK